MVTFVRRDRARDAGEERGQPGARAGREIEPAERHLHRARRDVDDAAELLRFTIGSITFWMSSIATIMLPTTPSIIFCRSSSRKSRNGGPALLLTRMSGSGQAANSAFWPSGGRDVGHDRDHLGAGRLGDLGGGRLRSSPVAPVDHDLAAGLRQLERAGAAEPAARGADDGLAAGDAEIHGQAPRAARRWSREGSSSDGRPCLWPRRRCACQLASVSASSASSAMLMALPRQTKSVPTSRRSTAPAAAGRAAQRERRQCRQVPAGGRAPARISAPYQTREGAEARRHRPASRGSDEPAPQRAATARRRRSPGRKKSGNEARRSRAQRTCRPQTSRAPRRPSGCANGASTRRTRNPARARSWSRRHPRQLGAERADAAGRFEHGAPPQHRLALGEAEAERVGAVLPARLVGVEEGAFELGPEAVRAASDRRRADQPGVRSPGARSAAGCSRAASARWSRRCTIQSCAAACQPLTQLLSFGLALMRSSPTSSRARTCGCAGDQALDQRHDRIARRARRRR